jgi:hypothetical protein
VRVSENRSVYEVLLISKTEGKRHLGRHRRRWQKKIKGLMGSGSSFTGGEAAEA